MDDRQVPIVEHLRDLRKSLGRAMVGVVIAMIACFAFAGDILAWLRRPMEKVLGSSSQFIVLAPHEYFFTEMKAALVAGIFLASPWIMFQIWLFVAPGLYRRERRLAAAFVVATVFFFVAGAYFGHTFVFPPMFEFFIGTLPPDIHGAYSVGLLFGFATNLLLAFGLVFETPVVVFLLVLMDLVDIESLAKWRRYVVVVAFVIAAILTPTPDPITQTMMAVPIVLLYELGLLAARVLIKKRVESVASAN
jgi:sec-independent protein translocase protein TatC